MAAGGLFAGFAEAHLSGGNGIDLLFEKMILKVIPLVRVGFPFAIYGDPLVARR